MSRHWRRHTELSLLLNSAFAGLLLAIPLVCAAQTQVTLVSYDNPVAGFTITVPEDWEMATGSLGNVIASLEGDPAGVCRSQPVLWFIYAKQGPEQTAKNLAKALQSLDGGGPQPRATGNAGEWEVQHVSGGARGAIWERWLCRSEGGRSYVIAAFIGAEHADRAKAQIEAALGSCHLIPKTETTRFREPRENAYRMRLPTGWQWEGRIFRSEGVPGYFEWKTTSPDGLCGAFSAPPATFNIAVPYMPAEEAAAQLVLPGLQQQIPGLALEAVHPLPRASQHFTDLIRKAGIGTNPQVHKARADYTATVNGTRIRIRATIATVMLDASPILGGRGNWMMLCSGAWAPTDRFDALFPVGRGVLASLVTDEVWNANMFEAVDDVRIWKEWVRRWRQFLFNVLYLDAEESAPG